MPISGLPYRCVIRPRPAIVTVLALTGKAHALRVREAMDSPEHPRKARKILGSLGLGSNVFKLTETLAALRALSDDDLQEVLGMHRGSLRAL